jgi:ApbE superfamily uncharacterized protein (UPF0280 family)
MIREHFQYRTTIATILADEQGHIEAAKAGMIAARQEIEGFIASDPFFAATFEPYSPPSDLPAIRRMEGAAASAAVGPMAAVAGTIAWAGVEAMQEAGAALGVIDNGGDIALTSDRELHIGLYAGSSPLSNRIAFRIPPEPGILGVCTSSATVGPSISFGIADAVTVFSRDVSLADAWATSICNRVLDCGEDLSDALSGTGVSGVFVVIGGKVCRWGEVPPLMGAHVDERLITAGR